MKHCVVIGGGVVGLTTAWALAERGLQVSLVEREAAVGTGASRANGGQLSYRYVSPLADEGVPLKALRWLLDPDGPLRFKPSLFDAHQWAWMFAFLRACRSQVNRRTTARLLELGAHSQACFATLMAEAGIGADEIELRAPGKLVVYRKPAEFARVAAKLGSVAKNGPEQALSHDECVALEPALQSTEATLAGGIFTAGEAVADCYKLCVHLAERLSRHGNFRGFVQAEALGFVERNGAAVALKTHTGDEIAADEFIVAAGLQSRALMRTAGVSLPLYPLKGYSLTVPIDAAQHLPPVVSVTDFEKKILYARIGDSELRVAAMVDMVGEDLRLDPKRIDSLKRACRATFPQAADYDRAQPWAGLRPATPTGAPIVGAAAGAPRGVWLNVGHGALGFTFSFATADIVAGLVAGQRSPVCLDGLSLP